MSYWISLTDPAGEEIEVPLFVEGGSYAIGGTTVPSLNVTYNYARLFPFRSLDGRVAGDTVAELRKAVSRLGTVRDEDYWKPTAGNAGHALSILLSWAELHPSAIWEVH